MTVLTCCVLFGASVMLLQHSYGSAKHITAGQAQGSTAQHSTAQHSTAQHSTAQRRAGQGKAGQGSTDLEVLHPEQVQDHGVCEAKLALKLGGFACHHLAHITLVRNLSHTTRPHYLVLTPSQDCLPSTYSMQLTAAECHVRVSLQSITAVILCSSGFSAISTSTDGILYVTDCTDDCTALKLGGAQ